MKLSIKDLPGYLRSVRDRGQDPDDIPVVDMGQIIMPRTNWLKRAAYISSFCFIIGLGLVYSRSFNVIIETNSNIQELSDIVSEYGGNLYFVKQNEDTYKVKIFTFKNINNLIKKLKENKELKKVEIN